MWSLMTITSGLYFYFSCNTNWCFPLLRVNLITALTVIARSCYANRLRPLRSWISTFASARTGWASSRCRKRHFGPTPLRLSRSMSWQRLLNDSKNSDGGMFTVSLSVWLSKHTAFFTVSQKCTQLAARGELSSHNSFLLNVHIIWPRLRNVPSPPVLFFGV